jgi:hypothetical protein
MLRKVGNREGTGWATSRKVAKKVFTGWCSARIRPRLDFWERGEWWLCGDGRPWQPDAVIVISDRLVFRPRLSPVA